MEREKPRSPNRGKPNDTNRPQKEYEKLQRISIEYRKLSNTHGVSADSIADKEKKR